MMCGCARQRASNSQRGAFCATAQSVAGIRAVSPRSLCPILCPPWVVNGRKR